MGFYVSLIKFEYMIVVAMHFVILIFILITGLEFLIFTFGLVEYARVQ